MAARIEDYALLGDCHTAALSARDGSIDWLCLPHFNSGSCFTALLGTAEHGRWLLAPREEVRSIRRRYRNNSLILETEYTTASGLVKLIEWMPPRTHQPSLARLVVGQRGQVPMRLELRPRFDYGAITPWIRLAGREMRALAGPNALLLRSDVELHCHDEMVEADFTVSPGQHLPFVLVWHPSHQAPPSLRQAEELLEQTERWWEEWTGRCTYRGPWQEAVIRSLITLKALTYAPTGSIVAAPTTSLPEHLGGIRNWDYRFCWLRDATFTLYALLAGGYTDEAGAWREWLIRAVAGDPSQLNPMYGLAGEHRLTEEELSWLPGYENSRPVRQGNAAWEQFQLDLFGEVMDALHQARRKGLPPEQSVWHVEHGLTEYLESAWHRPDKGIWEVRGPARHFTHSKVMAWVAVDRAIRSVERFGHQAPLEALAATPDHHPPGSLRQRL